MAAALLRTRPGLLRAVWRAARIAMLRFEINDAERWVSDCHRQGITSTEQLAYQLARIEELRVELALVEQSA